MYVCVCMYVCMLLLIFRGIIGCCDTSFTILTLKLQTQKLKIRQTSLSKSFLKPN